MGVHVTLAGGSGPFESPKSGAGNHDITEWRHLEEAKNNVYPKFVHATYVDINLTKQQLLMNRNGVPQMHELCLTRHIASPDEIEKLDFFSVICQS